MLTQQQTKNIHNLDVATVLEIMHECAERLGIVSVEEYSDIMCIPRRTIYSKIHKKEILFFEIGMHKFPAING